MKLLFNLGRILVTDAAHVALIRARQSDYEFLIPHQSGDWGDALPDLHAKNEAALARPGAGRLMSIYTSEYGDRLVVDTQCGGPGEPIATTVSLLSENEFPKSDAEGRQGEGCR
jgi:hypothetical protein